MKKDVLGLIGVFIAVLTLGAYFLWATPAPELSYAPVDLDGGSITVADQEDLTQVILDAELVKPGWITIHESLSGAPAEVVGTSELLEAGIHTDLVIPIDGEMLPGYTYIALLHVDDGNSVFNIQEDLPVRVNGEVVRPDFVADPSSIRIPPPEEE